MAQKLTRTQQEIVDLMKQGWELGIGRDFEGRCWIQQGGVGKGGKSRSVRINTAYALIDKGIVKCVSDSFPTSVYVLADQKGS